MGLDEIPKKSAGKVYRIANLKLRKGEKEFKQLKTGSKCVRRK